MGGKRGAVDVEIDMGKYITVTLELGDAEKLLRSVSKKLGYETQDVSEALRYMRNFDAFYEVMKKKFKDYLVPPKSMNDMIRGTVIVDKVKLIREGDSKLVALTFDRRVDVEKIVEALKDLGFEASIKKRSLA